MTALSDLLDHYRSAAMTEREKGTYFEELNDKHIFDAVRRSSVSRVFVSIFGDEEGKDYGQCKNVSAGTKSRGVAL